MFELNDMFKKFVNFYYDSNDKTNINLKSEFNWIEQIFLELIYSKNIYIDLSKLELLNNNIHDLSNTSDNQMKLTNLEQLIKHIEINLYVHKIFSNLFNLLDLIEYLITYDCYNEFANIFNNKLKNKLIEFANNFENSNVEQHEIVKVKIKNSVNSMFYQNSNMSLISAFSTRGFFS
jgi:hypothetical protein